MARPKTGYRTRNGTKVPGVTTITSRFGNKEALMGWNYNKGYADAEEGLPKNRFKVVQDAADIGSYVHEMARWHAEGEYGAPPKPEAPLTFEMTRQAHNGYLQFLDWEHGSNVKIVAWEEFMISEKYGFGGTPDAIFELPRYNDVGDYKNAKRFYQENLIQVCAYMLLLEENFPEYKTEGIQIVRFSKTEAIFAHERIGPGRLIEQGKLAFLRELELWNHYQVIDAAF